MARLDAFLGDGAEGENEPVAVEAEAPVVETPEPEPEAPAPEPEAAAPEAPAAPAPDDDSHLPEDVRGLRAAVQAERNMRKDHKGRADKLEGELAAIRAELEAARKVAATPPPAPVYTPPVVQAPPPPPPEPIPVPNPVEDPAGYHRYMQQQMEERLTNQRFDTSEQIVRQQYGDDDVNAKLAIFQKAAAENPALGLTVKTQAHPWLWMVKQAERISAMAEIGGDPNAYRAKVEAEIRAKAEEEFAKRAEEIRTQVQAEYAAAAAAVGSPAAPAQRVVLPQSLGTARSAAPRSMPVEQVPEFSELFARKRKG